MTEQEQIEEMAKKMYTSVFCEPTCECCNNKKSCIRYIYAERLYNAGYRKTFISDLASDTQNAFKDGYIKGNIDGMLLARKETAREIFQRVINICRKEEDFQDGTVNTQLEPLYFGIMNGCAFVRGEVKELAKQYGVEVEE